jgi:hypothetical protein
VITHQPCAQAPIVFILHDLLHWWGFQLSFLSDLLRGSFRSFLVGSFPEPVLIELLFSIMYVFLNSSGYLYSLWCLQSFLKPTFSILCPDFIYFEIFGFSYWRVMNFWTSHVAWFFLCWNLCMWSTPGLTDCLIRFEVETKVTVNAPRRVLITLKTENQL